MDGLPLFPLDICNIDPSCDLGSWKPVFRDRRAAGSDVDIDMAFLLDGSESTTLLQFNEMKKYIGYLVRQLDLSPDPKASQHFARVAVVQHSAQEAVGNASVAPVKVEVSLTDYGSKDKLLGALGSRMARLQGTQALGPAIDYTVEHVFEGAPNPRDLKVLVLLLTGEVRGQQLQELQTAVLQAKCKGYFFVILGIGRKVNVKELYSLASEPNDVFFKLVDQPTELSEEPLLRFGRLLPSFVSSESASDFGAPGGLPARPHPRAPGGGGPMRGKGDWWADANLFTQCECCSQQVGVSTRQAPGTLSAPGEAMRALGDPVPLTRCLNRGRLGSARL